jgi:hypothetical protein
MLQTFLNWLRRSFRDACIGGVQDALDELEGKEPTAAVADVRQRIAALTAKTFTAEDGEEADGEKPRAVRNGRARHAATT